MSRILEDTEMRVILYIILALVGLVLLLSGGLGIVGSMLPATHTASMSVEVGKPRAEVWRLVDDVNGFPSWLPGITKVEMMPERNGHRTFRQTQGRNSFVLEETVKREPEIVTRTIADDNKMFSGSWEHTFEELSDGRTRVTLKETGTVPSPIPRAMMKLLVGYDYYLKQFGKSLRAECGG